MRPVRFVALSEDGQALVLSDEVGRLLSLSLDDRLASAVRHDKQAHGQLAMSMELSPALSPRDIQARIRAGDSAEEVARVANVPVDRVLRYAGPVLQERAMLAQHGRRTRLRSSESGESLAEVIDKRLAEHGVDAEKVSWDAYRREDGTWRIVASWPSGKATAQAVWQLDKARQVITAHDDMAQFLSAERPAPLLGQDPVPEPELSRPTRDPVRPFREHAGHEPIRPTREDSDELPSGRRSGRDVNPGRDPMRREALRAALDRPLGEPARPASTTDDSAARNEQPAASAASHKSDFRSEDDTDTKEIPAVPSLAVLRGRRTDSGSGKSRSGSDRGQLPSWDDVLFGGK
ncbi:MAG: septation protein SepH [Micromonosporaceae bacterium]